MIHWLLRPLLVCLLLVGIFGIVGLRSRILSLEYEIGAMERHKAGALKEVQALRADLASLLSIKEVDERKISLVFPDRKKVIYVKRDLGGVPHTASLKGKGR